MTFRPTTEFFLKVRYGRVDMAIDCCKSSLDKHKSWPKDMAEVRNRISCLDECLKELMEMPQAQRRSV